MKKQHMIRLDDEIYKKLITKKAEMINKYDANYTLSELIDVILLEANYYEEHIK